AQIINRDLDAAHAVGAQRGILSGGNQPVGDGDWLPGPDLHHSQRIGDRPHRCRRRRRHKIDPGRHKGAEHEDERSSHRSVKHSLLLLKITSAQSCARRSCQPPRIGTLKRSIQKSLSALTSFAQITTVECSTVTSTLRQVYVLDGGKSSLPPP